MMGIYPLGDAFGIKDDFIPEKEKKNGTPGRTRTCNIQFGN